MENQGRPEAIRSKVILLLLDKFVLAIVLAAVGFIFSLMLQRDKTVGEYQRILFDRRMEGYVAILEEVRHARELFAAFFVHNREKGWRENLERVQHRARVLASATGGFGGGSTWASYDDVLGSLENIDRIRREKGLYFSKEVGERIDRFLSTTLAEIDEVLKKAEQKKARRAQGAEENVQPEVEARRSEQTQWQRVNAACDDLSEAIKESLRINGILLG